MGYAGIITASVWRHLSFEKINMFENKNIQCTVMIMLDTVRVTMYAVYTVLDTVMIRLGTVRIRMYTV